MSELLKPAVPVPSVVELFAVVGAVEVFQTTPLAEMVPPFAEMPEPPLAADAFVMLVIAVVVVIAGFVIAVADAVGAEAVKKWYVAAFEPSHVKGTSRKL